MEIRILSVMVLAIGCGGGANSPTPASEQAAGGQADKPSAAAVAESPRPSPFEIDFRRRSDRGEDEVLKLTEFGARYGIAHGRNRVALRYDLDPAELDAIYEVFTQQSFKTIETQVVASSPTSGSSIRMKAGPSIFTVSAMGRRGPVPDHIPLYDRCAEAVLDALPSEQGPVVIEVRWDASMADQAAAVDIDVGNVLAGVHPLEGAEHDVAVHLREPRDIQVLVRHSSPPKTTTLDFESDRHAGIALRFDEPSATVQAALVPHPT